MVRTLNSLFVSLLILTAGAIAAEPTKGQSYVLAAPYDVLTLEKTSLWNGKGIFRASIDATPSGATLINGNADWLGGGAPNIASLTLSKDKTDKKTGIRTLTLVSDRAEINLSFNAQTLPPAALDLVLLPQQDSTRIAEYQSRAYAALADRRFASELHTISREARIRYLQETHGSSLPSIAVVTYKEKTYLSLDLGSGTSVYNTLQLNQAQRVARVISQELLPELKRAEPLLASATDSIYGIKILFQIPWKNFLKEYENGQDPVALYVPSEKLRFFMNADITSQAMIDASFIIVDGNRIEVTLSQQ